MNIVFSVVIPAYNRENEIVRAVKSVLNQSFRNFEIIVVDDGSSDGTMAAVKSIQDNRVKYIHQNNSGACVARNTGIANACGKYVSFLDSDDAWHSTMLEKQYKIYQSDEDVGCVYSKIQIISGEGKCYPFGKTFGVYGFCYPEVLKQGYMAPTTVLSAKKECLETVGRFDTSLPASQDDDICFKLSKNFKIGFIDEILADMYVGQINRISNNPKRVADGWWMLWNKYEEDVIKYCGSEVMQIHYLNCVKRYAAIKDEVLYRKALGRFVEIGGKLKFKDKLSILVARSKFGSFMKKIIRRII